MLGNTTAMTIMGLWSQEAGDLASARRWMTRAADLGNQDAIAALAEL